MMSNAEQQQGQSAVRAYLLSLRSPDDPVVASRIARLSEWISPPVVWAGIDGRRLAASDYYRHLVRAHYQHGQVVTPAEVGVSLSHVTVMDDFLASTADVAIVFEDDVVIKPESGQVLNAALPFVRANDILVACDQRGLEYIGAARGRPLASDRGCLEILRDDWRIVKRTCAYALGRQAAMHLRDVQNRGLWPSDDFRVLCPPDGRLLYCGAFGHPPDDEGSVVAPERALKAASRVRPLPLARRLAAEVMRTFGPRITRVSRDVRSRLNGYKPI
jgi:glycosyl transferase family 25